MKIAVQGLRLDGANWIFSYRFVGRARRMTIGKFPAVTAKDASKGASILAGMVCCGRCPSSERKAARRREIAAAAPVRDTIEKVAAAYLKHAKARTRESTFTETKRFFMREVLPHWRGKRLSEISRQDVRQLVDRVQKRGAPIGANKLLSTVKTFFNWCVSEDILTASPAAAIKAPCPEVARERTLTDSELGAVLGACAGPRPVWRGREVAGAFRPETFRSRGIAMERS
jgi:Phage integrase, N-terminal SAM-like domain